MNGKYEEYLSLCTRKMMDYLSLSGAGQEERNTVISALSDFLAANIISNSLINYEKVIYDASIQYLDKEVSQVLAHPNASYKVYETAVLNCRRISELIQLYGAKRWQLPGLSNLDIARCESILRERQASISLSSKVTEEDKTISELLPLAEKKLEVKLCNQILTLLDELGNDLKLCKQNKISYPIIVNKDIKKITKYVSSLQAVSEKKEVLYQKISDMDLKIYNVDSLAKSTPEQWNNVINFCNQQRILLAECQKKQWPLPSLKYNSVDAIANRYQHYLDMDLLDKEIAKNRSNLSSAKKYRNFFINCHQQNINLQICKKNGWIVPELTVSDPAVLEKNVQKEKVKWDKAKKLKRNFILVAIGSATLISLIVFARGKYVEGKVKIPFDATYAIGIDVNNICQELDDAGFENISKKQDISGWLDSGEVTGVSIDDRDTYNKNQYKKPDVSVVVNYSSDNRTYVTDLLKDWKTANYKKIETLFRSAGFLNIMVISQETLDKELDQRMCALSLNNMEYKNEHCYLPKNAPIVITYYSLRISIGTENNDFIGQDYEDVVKNLKDRGFTNIQTEEISNGWGKGNSVINVTANNMDNYDGKATFEPDAKIVVKYSSNDRMDVTSVLEKWSSQKYDVLQTSLANKGFNNVTLKETNTTEKSKNFLVANLTINNSVFSAGACFIQKAAPIVIEYYILNIRPGNSASSYESNKEGNYTSVVEELKNMGFTNVSVYRNNDLFNGWVTKEGSIEKISIDGNDSFSDDDLFRYDVPIVIVVNTFKGKGCEDIILTEP